MFKTITTSITTAMRSAEKALKDAGEALDEIDFDGIFEDATVARNTVVQDKKSTRVTTDHMNIKITGQDVVINGDVKSIRLNGKLLLDGSKT